MTVIHLFRAFLIFCLFQLFTLQITAQSKIDSINPTAWSISFSPSALLNAHQGYQFGVQKGLKGIGIFELEYAHIFDQRQTSAPLYFDDDRKHGYRLKLGYKRLYMNRVIGLLTLNYRKTVHEDSALIPYNNDDNASARYENPAYYEVWEDNTCKTLIGLTAGIGMRLRLVRRLGVEFSGSLGPGMYLIKHENFPENARKLRNATYDTAGTYFYPVVALSAKVFYQITGPRDFRN